VKKIEDKPLVLVAVLAGDCKVNTSIAEFAWVLPYLSSRPDSPFRYKLLIVPGVNPQTRARNIACEQAIEDRAEFLLMIDNDMIVTPTTLNILNTDADVIGSMQMMYRQPYDDDSKVSKEWGLYPCVFDRLEDGKQHPRWRTPESPDVEYVDRVGSGCMAIRLKVLRDTRMILGESAPPRALWRNVFDVNGVRTMGLDMDFCDRAKGAGYRVAVNWTAEVGHMKTTNLNDLQRLCEAQRATGFEAGRRHELEAIRVEENGSRAGSREGGDVRQRNGHDDEVARAGVDRPGDTQAGEGTRAEGEGSHEAPGPSVDDAGTAHEVTPFRRGSRVARAGA